MKQPVSDISQTWQVLLAELQSLRETIKALYSENRLLNRNTKTLLKENRKLRKRLEKYETGASNTTKN